MQDTKYITFKMNDWDEMVSDYRIRPKTEQDFNKWARDHMLTDSVVIRLRDKFAGPALHTYANMVAISASVLKELAPSTADRLQSIADYFHDRAVEADEVARPKLPD